MHALQTEEFTIRSEVLPSPTILRHATTNVGTYKNVGKRRLRTDSDKRESKIA